MRIARRQMTAVAADTRLTLEDVVDGVREWLVLNVLFNDELQDFAGMLLGFGGALVCLNATQKTVLHAAWMLCGVSTLLMLCAFRIYQIPIRRHSPLANEHLMQRWNVLATTFPTPRFATFKGVLGAARLLAKEAFMRESLKRSVPPPHASTFLLYIWVS